MPMNDLLSQEEVDALLAVGRLDAARDALPAALLFANLYDNEALLGLLRYLLLTDNPEQVAIVYHAGAELGTYFKSGAQSSHFHVAYVVDEPAKPPKVMQRFAELYREWVAPVFQPEKLSLGALWNASYNFQKIHKRELQPEIDTADAARELWRGRREDVRRAFESRDLDALEAALNVLSRVPMDSDASQFLGELAAQSGLEGSQCADRLFREACSFWRPANGTLTAYCDLCAADANLVLPDHVVRDLPIFVRFGDYGSRKVLSSALLYHRAKSNIAQTRELETLRESLGATG